MSSDSPKGSARVETEHFEIKLDRARETVYLSSIRDLKAGELLLGGDSDTPLWRISARQKEKIVATESLEYPARFVQGEKGIKVAWEGEIFGAESRVVLSITRDEAGLLAMGLEFRSDAPVPLWEITFPVLGRLSKGTLLAPYGYGKALPSERAERYVGRYPGHNCTMQFLALSIGDSNLYVGAHDPRSNAKFLEFLPEGPLIEFRLPLPDMGSDRRSFSIPYPTVLGVVRGNWYDVARLYRRWALKQSWSSAGPVETRAIPRRIKDVVLWLRGAGSPEDVVPKALMFKRYFDVPVGLHWYVWHRIPFDDSYPEYFPAKRGFREGVARLRRAGIVVMPYINARLWDAKTESWSEEGADRAAAKTPDLERYVETYGSKVPLSPMCPSTELWQRKIASIAQRLASDYGVDGLYLDQIGAAAPKLCYDPSHGHPLGGGSWWVEGYRDLLDHVRTEVSRIDADFFLTTESNAEPWVDRLDGLLMCNSTEGDLVPLYPTVYGDMILAFGAYIFRHDLEDSWAFRTKVSQMFLWGTQLGWLGPEILEPEFSNEAEYLRELARVRQGAGEFLRDGELLRPPRMEGGARRVRTTWELWGRKWEIRMPVAQASCWKAPDGSVGIVACNMGDEEENLQINVSLTDPGWRGLSSGKLEKGSVAVAKPRISGNDLHLNLDLDARSALLLSTR